MERFKQLITIVTLLALSACAPLEKAVNPYEEDFKCRASDETGKCIDTPSAYKEARYPNIEEPLQPGMPTPGFSEPDQRYQMVTGLLEEPQKPILQPPKIMRVLLLPYEGEGGELFMTRYVYLKVEESDWILSDISETQE
ncbi:TraV family lipoprotein [Desulfopila sp. IMCC35008]|uniref:TraV family lipoprotein n=1 Tax=Desulfopila sp. IMCC35008 TaxID=2653858 RepID=UPI0013D16C47|nr:TraV family lipoprotein [Desulfopila sp. IMCC35008]